MPRDTIIVSGSLAYDRIMDFPGRFADHIVPGKIHVLNVSFAVANLTEHFGGTAGNIAYNLTLLGVRPAVVAAAGHDFGPYRAWLTRHGVGVTAVRTVAGERTACAYIITDADDNQITGFHAGAMGQRGRAVSAKLLRGAALAVVSPGNVADMLSLPAAYRRGGLPYFFDPGQQLTALSGPQLRHAVSGALGFIANDYELALVLKKTGWTLPKLLRAASLVVVTLGPKGSRVYQRGRVVTAPAAKPRTVLDPTGAGDAYRAGFLYGWLRRWPVAVTARFAGLVAVYTVEAYGTQTHRFRWADLRRRYRQNFGGDFPSDKK